MKLENAFRNGSNRWHDPEGLCLIVFLLSQQDFSIKLTIYKKKKKKPKIFFFLNFWVFISLEKFL